MDKQGFRTEEAVYGSANYEGLRALWCGVFGDEPGYVDSFYENFGDQIKGYTAVDAAGSVCSALTCHLCGTYTGRPVYISYAVCTREDMRGQGLGGMLTAYARDIVTAAGGISVVSPAEPELEDFYAGLGYEPCFFADERLASADTGAEGFEDCSEYDLDMGIEIITPLKTATNLQRIPVDVYNRHRESFLADRPHIELSGDMLRLIESECAGGLFLINKGDAICALSGADAECVVLSELIVDPRLADMSSDIDGEIAALIAERFGSAKTIYRTPGSACQSMAAGLSRGGGGYVKEPYYGFPID